MFRFVLVFILWISLSSFLWAQSYNNWITGDTSDIQTTDHQAGIVLAGGGSDNDNAMRWMLKRANGGDVLIIRASRSDGYNSYFFNELGVAVNSVETIRFNNAAAATDPYVLRKIREAEILFIAGGDQYDYYQYWKDNAVEDAINYLINEKQITVGGTSAGMAILGGAYYTPNAGSLTTSQALANPFHVNINILGQGDFIQTPLLKNTVTDTHYDQRDRSGRHVTFMSRLIQEHGGPVYGIACNEGTAVVIDENGFASVFGDSPKYDDYAYFIQSNCEAEMLVENEALDWNHHGSALLVYRIPGNPNAENRFNLNDWETGNGGDWMNWYVDSGKLFQESGSDSSCLETVTSTASTTFNTGIDIYPSPFSDKLTIEVETSVSLPIPVEIYDAQGKLVFKNVLQEHKQQFDLSTLGQGNYFLKMGQFKTQIQKAP